MVRAALRLMWKDTCSIIEYQDYTRENKSTGKKEVYVLENEPCKLSFDKLHTVNQTETAAVLVQSTKLFIDENIIIKPGSKIIVNRGDKVFEYGYSGVAAIFTNHQEITLAPFEGFA